MMAELSAYEPAMEDKEEASPAGVERTDQEERFGLDGTSVLNADGTIDLVQVRGKRVLSDFGTYGATRDADFVGNEAGDDKPVLRRSESLCGHDHMAELLEEEHEELGRRHRVLLPFDLHLHERTRGWKKKKKEAKKEKKRLKEEKGEEQYKEEKREIKYMHKREKLEMKADKLKNVLAQRQLTIIAFVNPHSGAQLGEMVMPHLKAILGEDRVFDILADGIKPALERFKDAPNLRVLVGGGDGTYHSVIQAMIESDIHPLPPLGTMPLGTGNDLARQFGWGGSLYPKRKKVLKLIRKFALSATLTPLDIWMVRITPRDPDSLQLLEEEATSQIMFNYFNAGFEAGVSYRFDRLRKRHQNIFKARKLNQIGYGFSAIKSLANGGNQSLRNLIELEVDGSRLATPQDLKTLVILNFQNYQAGLDIWGKPKGEEVRQEPAIDDQIAEVVGLGGVRHEFKVRTHIRKGYHLAQGKRIKINVFTDIAINYDGEPFVQKGPCEIRVEPWCMAFILTNPKTKLDVNLSSEAVPTRSRQSSVSNLHFENATSSSSGHQHEAYPAAEVSR